VDLRRPLLAGVAAVVFVAPVTARASASPAHIARIVARSGVAAGTSVTITRRDGSVVFARAAATARIPASNQKLETMLTALQVLGPGYRFTTEARMAGGVIYLVGGGDPTLSRGRLVSLARRVRAAGIAQVSGVVADGSLFDTIRGVASWKAGFSPKECAPLSALALDGDWAGGKAVWNPERRAAVRFRLALRRAGVAVTGKARTGTTPAAATPTATVQSRPLRLVLRKAGKDSDNFTAEMVLKAVAAASGRQGSTAWGVHVVRSVLRRRGLDVSQIRVVDGSGLSLADRTTTAFLAALVRNALADPDLGPAFADTLTVAGVDGTLKQRMTKPPARGVLRGKTGTLNQSSALTAVLPGYVLSVITNGSRVNITRAHKLQDHLGQLLAAG
jgi:serine-type D-Ala-D-Ala carboxypeptidase/endopeptidase (penicillin-binding protein 4)